MLIMDEKKNKTCFKIIIEFFSKKKDNIAKTYRPISVCGGNGAKLLSLEEAQDKYKQVGPAEIPKYHTVIEIPEYVFFFICLIFKIDFGCQTGLNLITDFKLV
jgi:hypothetical protein